MIEQHIYHFFLFFFSERLSNSMWELDVLLFLEFINIVFTLFYNFIEFIIVYFFNYFFSSIQIIYKLVSFEMRFPAFICASANDNLWGIHLGVETWRHFAKCKWRALPFCCLLKCRMFSTILITLFEFSFWGISLLLTELLKSINDSLGCFIILSSLIWLYSCNSFVKDDGSCS